MLGAHAVAVPAVDQRRRRDQVRERDTGVLGLPQIVVHQLGEHPPAAMGRGHVTGADEIGVQHRPWYRQRAVP